MMGHSTLAIKTVDSRELDVDPGIVKNQVTVTIW